MATQTDADRLDALRAVPLFSGLSERSLQHVARVAKDFDVPAGHVLIEAKREASGLFVIEEGTVVVERSGQTFERGPGTCIGELALLTDTTGRTARVRATSPVHGVAIARADFKELVDSEPKIALGMLEVLAERLATSDPH